MDRIKISVVEHWIVECYNSSERIMKCNDKMKDSGRHKKNNSLSSLRLCICNRNLTAELNLTN